MQRSDGPALAFSGFRDQDIAALSKSGLTTPIAEQPHSLDGHNWGAIALEGATMAFQTKGKPAFRIALPDVTQVQQGRDEVMLEFPVDDTAMGDRNDALAGISFYIPKNNPEFAPPHSEDGLNGTFHTAASKVFFEKISEFTDAGTATGDAIATFDSVGVIVPRGRFDIEMYTSSFKLLGQAQDFRVQYDSIIRIFLLPKPNSATTVVAISLDPPIRRGQTQYPHILCQFQSDEDTTIELDISEEALTARNERSKASGGKGDLIKQLTGPSPEVFAKVLRGLSGAKLSKPGSFRDAEGTGPAVKCSYKADDGHLYPLERAFFYVQKPPLLLPHDEIDSVEFLRQATGVTAARTFDLAVRMKSGADHLFRGIPRSEWTNLFEFIQAKQLRIENFREAKAGPGAAAMAYAMEEGPDAGFAKMGATGEMSSDEDDEEDEDFAASEISSSEESGSESDGDAKIVDEAELDKPKKKKKKRKERPAANNAEGVAQEAGTPDEAPQKKQRKKKDPNAPKKALSAFMVYSNDVRAQVKEDNPGIAFGDVAKVISEKWKALGAEEKAPYEAKAAADKDRYAQEKKEYDAGKQANVLAEVKEEEPTTVKVEHAMESPAVKEEDGLEGRVPGEVPGEVKAKEEEEDVNVNVH